MEIITLMERLMTLAELALGTLPSREYEQVCDVTIVGLGKRDHRVPGRGLTIERSSSPKVSPIQLIYSFVGRTLINVIRGTSSPASFLKTLLADYPQATALHSITLARR